MKVLNKKNSVTDSLRELQSIPGVGASLSLDLVDLGYLKVTSLKGENPENMYQSLMDLRKQHVDRCVCCTFSGAQFITLVILFMSQIY